MVKDLNYEEICSTDDWQYSISKNGSLRIINLDENTELLLALNKVESNQAESILEEIKKEMKIMNEKILEQEQEIKNLKGQRTMPVEAIKEEITEAINLMKKQEEIKMKNLEEKLTKKIEEVQNQASQRLLNLEQKTKKYEEEIE